MKRFRWIVVGVMVGLTTGTGCEETKKRTALPKTSEKIGEVALESVPVEEPPAEKPVSVAPPLPVAPELPPGATLLDSDMVWDRRDPDSFALSPDEKWIAYVSKGALWLCSITGGPPTKLVDLPGTVTEFHTTPRYRQKRVHFNKMDSGVSSSDFYEHPKKKDLVRVDGLKWPPSQDGVFYVLGSKLRKRPWTATHQVMHASTQGIVTTLATISRDAYIGPEYLRRFDITHDRSKVVASGFRPILWDTGTDKPRATPFDYLIPSSTSGRFLGIEIDTRQLVMTDENLKIEKRFGVFFDSQKTYSLFWSPDERFVIGVTSLDIPHRQKWIGFRMDLETEERRLLDEGHYAKRSHVEGYVFDQFIFTGRGGEVIRAGRYDRVPGGFLDGRNGSFVALMPEGEGPNKEIGWFVRYPLQGEKGDRITRNPYPPIRLNKDGSLFVMAFPREERKLGHRYWLLDREGNKWPMGPDDPTLCASPYHVVALADNGKQVIACDGVQLFSIPVATIQMQAKEAKDE